MKTYYKNWLSKRLVPSAVSTQLSQAGRIEKLYGDLDQLFDGDGLDGLINAFHYTADDERNGRPNPTLIPINLNVRGSLASYKTSLRYYRKFREQLALDAGESEQTSGKQPARSARSHSLSWIDGLMALERLIAQSEYKTLAQAVASLTLFSHPKTVAQTFYKSVFRTIRGRPAGTCISVNGQRVMLDNNKSPTDAFMWVHGWTSRPRDVQFNHIYKASGDVASYTCLANICVTPAFIAKLTDESNQATNALLKYHAFRLYEEWKPSGVDNLNKPEGYDDLKWPTENIMDPVDNVRASLEARIRDKPGDRTVLSLKDVGWLYDGI